MSCECDICRNNKFFELPDEIVEATIEGNLVLFCGAGISTEGKTVLPYSFYESVKNDLDIKDNAISFSCLMQQYCDRPNGRKKLLRKIRDRFQYIHSFPELERRATEFHRELAAIYPIRTIITTNWDTFFEEYCGATPITIPEDFAFWDENSRYVLKIHGSIQNLSSIIATTKDYNKCFKELESGIVGATLKTILATKIVVFVGYSFGDEDFIQIIDYLRNEMGEIYPHIYIVTLDKTLKERLNYENSTSIMTSGTFFLHQLKLMLIDKKIIKNNNIYWLIDTLYDEIKKLHEKVSGLDLTKYPGAIYTLSYQDGIIHSFERFLQNYKTGEYNQPGRMGKIAGKYEEWIEKAHVAGDFWNEAYYEGYTNGLVLLEAIEDDNNIVNEFPLLYLPNAKIALTTYTIFMDELTRVSKKNDKFLKYAKKIIEGKIGDGMVVHHPPY